MEKVTIKVKLSSTEEIFEVEAKAELDSDILKYYEDEFTKVEVDFKNNILRRSNNQIKMEFVFDTTNITDNIMFINDIKDELYFKIKTNSIEKNDKYYKVNYEILDNDTFTYEVNIGGKYELY